MVMGLMDLSDGMGMTQRETGALMCCGHSTRKISDSMSQGGEEEWSICHELPGGCWVMIPESWNVVVS